MNKFKLLPFLALVVVLVSCSKDDPKTSKTDLISKTWKTTSFTIGGQDVFSLYDACEKDNLVIIAKDGKYKEDEGLTKCNPADPQIIDSGTWSFLENETKLKIVYSDSSSETYTITELTSTTLKLSITDTSSGTSVTGVVTLVAQ